MSDSSIRPYVTAPEYAAQHGVSIKTVQAWLLAGLVPGAYQSPPNTPRGTWLIPAAAQPPTRRAGRPRTTQPPARSRNPGTGGTP